MLFGHGDDLYNATGEVKVNFSSNVWYGTDLGPLREYINEQFIAVARYPEPDAGSLKELLASQFGVSEENLIITNGSITSFYMIAQTWAGARSMIVVPSFSEYEDACRLYKHTITFYSTFAALSEMSLDGIDLCWICNPNNPDGKLITRSELLELIGANPQTTFIIDQAYVGFTKEELLNPIDIKVYPNLVIIQSISKVHTIPGLRIGYLIASEEIVQKIKAYLIPWSVNTIAIEAGKYVLRHPEQFDLPLEKWRADTIRFMTQLNEIDDLEVLPTATTFFLVRLKKGIAADLKEYLLKEEGILIRDASNFRGLDKTYFRLSTQKMEENRALIEGIKKWRINVKTRWTFF